MAARYENGKWRAGRPAVWGEAVEIVKG